MGIVITLKGDLGSGKTTFAQGIGEALNISQRVNSPTFLVIKQYEISGSDVLKKLYHIDLYRLQSEKEIEEIGVKELLSDNEALCVIEWPERMGSLLPKKRLEVTFEYIDEITRKINIEKYE